MNKEQRQTEEQSQKRTSRITPVTIVCVIVGVVVLSAILAIWAWNARMPQRKPPWNSISNVLVDFSEMVTNRVFAVGADGDAVKADLRLKDMYFFENDFVFSLVGKVSCSRGTADCSMDVRAPVRFEQGKIFAGEMRLVAFAPRGLDLGEDEKFVAATLFEKVKGKIDVTPLKVDDEYKAIHSINNDFIEFEK